MRIQLILFYYVFLYIILGSTITFSSFVSFRHEVLYIGVKLKSKDYLFSYYVLRKRDY